MSQSSPVDRLISELEHGRIDRRQFLTRAAVLGLSLPAATAALAACGSSSTSSSGRGGGAPKRTGDLRVRFPVDIGNLDPASWTQEEDAQVIDCVLEGLVSFKPGTWDVVNTLAETFEPSADNLRYHFKLKRGIEFHGGYGELTAEDVKFSFERIAGLTKPKVDSPYQGDWSALESVKVEGKYAGTIVLKSVFAPLMRSTLPAMSGKVASKKAMEKLGKQFSSHPVGTGPYEFVSRVPQQRLVLKRFDGYGGANSGYASKPAYETITILPVTDDSAAKTALLAGDLDFGSVGTGDLDRLSSQLAVTRSPTLNYYWIALNVQDPVLKDPNLRQAIRYAVDVPGIITAAYDGKWERANTIIPKTMGLGYWSEAPTYDRDVEKAKSYLSKSGQRNLSLRLNLLNAQADKTAGQVIQSNLSDIGIQTQIFAQDSGTYFAIPGGGGGGKQRQLNYCYYVTEPDPSWSFVWWTCKQMGLYNWDNWCDQRFQKLYDEAITTTDESKRHEMYIEMQKLWDQQASVIWVAYPTNYFAGKKSVKPSLRPDGLPMLWNFGTIA